MKRAQFHFCIALACVLLANTAIWGGVLSPLSWHGMCNWPNRINGLQLSELAKSTGKECDRDRENDRVEKNSTRTENIKKPTLRKKGKPSNGCKRFATVRLSKGAGLGHRFSEVIFGMMFAELTNSTYVFDDASFFGRGFHGSYEWFRSFLPLSMTEITMDEYQRFVLKDARTPKLEVSWDNLTESNYTDCHSFLEASSKSCCKNNQIKGSCWCFSALSGAYEQNKWRILEAYEYSTFQPTVHMYRGMEDTLVIAWHIRTGDINLNKHEAYFETVILQLFDFIVDLSSHFFFFGENVTIEFPFLNSICYRHSLNCTFPELQSGNAFYHLVTSDVLITSGSSFAYVAALFHRGVVINARSKEGAHGVYELSEHGQMDSNGVIISPRHSHLHNQIRATYLHKTRNLHIDLDEDKMSPC